MNRTTDRRVRWRRFDVVMLLLNNLFSRKIARGAPSADDDQMALTAEKS